MKTKEIEGFVYLNHVPWIEEGVRMPFIPENCAEIGGQRVKAKLIIEIPEKKIELTESQFDEAVNYSFGDATYFHSLKTLKKKLFNQGGEG